MKRLLILILYAYVSSALAGDLGRNCKKSPLWELVNNTQRTMAQRSVHDRSSPITDSQLVNEAIYGHDDVVKKMVQDKNVASKFGPQALYAAASMGRQSTTMVLIMGGVPVDAAIQNKLTPIFGAVQYGCLDELSLLIKLGANINFKPNVPFTLLVAAVGGGYYEMARVIVQHGYKLDYSEKQKVRSILEKRAMQTKFEKIFPDSRRGGKDR